jgi:uncharacterized cupin superfamily protein
MKIYKLPDLSETNNGKEYCLGCEDLNTHAVYIVYGRLSPNESKRELTPLKEHEAILYLIKGEIRVTSEGTDFTISSGEAFHINEGECVILENLSDIESVYLMAGGNARYQSESEAPAQDQEQTDPHRLDKTPPLKTPL